MTGDDVVGGNQGDGPAVPLDHHHVEFVIGMVVSIDTRDTATDRAAITDVVEWLHHVDRAFSTHTPESPISAIGRGKLGLDDAGDTGGSIRTS